MARTAAGHFLTQLLLAVSERRYPGESLCYSRGDIEEEEEDEGMRKNSRVNVRLQERAPVKTFTGAYVQHAIYRYR